MWVGETRRDLNKDQDDTSGIEITPTNEYLFYIVHNVSETPLVTIKRGNQLKKKLTKTKGESFLTKLSFVCFSRDF